MQVGDRVVAVRDADDLQVRIFGTGKYEGDFLPPFWPFGMPEEEFKTMFNEMKASGELKDDAEPKKMPNPRIRLDNGKVIWGAQCWWGPEEAIKTAIGDREVIDVPVPEENVESVSDTDLQALQPAQAETVAPFTDVT
jgi:hypothetical protein